MARTHMAFDDRVRASNTLIKAAQTKRVDDPEVMGVCASGLRGVLLDVR